MISRFVSELEEIPSTRPDYLGEEAAERQLKKVMFPISQSLFEKYNYYLEPAFGPLQEKDWYDFLYQPETGLTGIEFILSDIQRLRDSGLWDAWRSAQGYDATREEDDRRLDAGEDTLTQQEIKKFRNYKDMLAILELIPEDEVIQSIANYTSNVFTEDPESGGSVGPFSDEDKQEILDLHRAILSGRIKLHNPVLTS
jgi:hypothetical protein